MKAISRQYLSRYALPLLKAVCRTCISGLHPRHSPMLQASASMLHMERLSNVTASGRPSAEQKLIGAATSITTPQVSHGIPTEITAHPHLPNLDRTSFVASHYLVKQLRAAQMSMLTIGEVKQHNSGLYNGMRITPAHLKEPQIGCTPSPGPLHYQCCQPPRKRGIAAPPEEAEAPAGLAVAANCGAQVHESPSPVDGFV